MAACAVTDPSLVIDSGTGGGQAVAGFVGLLLRGEIPSTRRAPMLAQTFGLTIAALE